MDCPEAIDLMADALEGRLPTRARAGFADHMVECPSCRNYFDQLGVTRRTLERLASDAATSPRRDELIAAFRKAFHRH